MALAVSALKQQIEQAKQSLKNVDDNIKKVTGRDPNELNARFDRGRGIRGRDAARLGRRVSSGQLDDDEPPAKRAGGVFRRIGSAGSGGRALAARRRSSQQEQDQTDDDEDDDSVKPAVQSSVVSAVKKVTKTQIISAQNVDEKGKARNRRMFGMLMGTLARFQNEESKADLALKQEQRRSEIERRLEEAQATDRRRIAAERRELFSERRSKQHKIVLLEEKVELNNEFEEWEKEWSKKSQFLITKTTPPIFFLPKDTTGRTSRALQVTEQYIKDKISESRASLQRTLEEIDREIASLDAEKDGKGKVDEGKKGDEGKKAEGDEIDDLTEEPSVDINVEVEDGKHKNDGGDEGGQSPTAEEGGKKGDKPSNGETRDAVDVEMSVVADVKDAVDDMSGDAKHDMIDNANVRNSADDVKHDAGDDVECDVGGVVQSEKDEDESGSAGVAADGKLSDKPVVDDKPSEAATKEDSQDVVADDVMQPMEIAPAEDAGLPEEVAYVKKVEPDEIPLPDDDMCEAEEGGVAGARDQSAEEEPKEEAEKHRKSKSPENTDQPDPASDDDVMEVSSTKKDEVIVVSSRSPSPTPKKRSPKSRRRDSRRSPSPKRSRVRRRSSDRSRRSSQRSRRYSSPKRRVQKRPTRKRSSSTSSSSSSSSVTSSDSEPRRRRRRARSSDSSSSSSSSSASLSPPRRRRRSRDRRRRSSSRSRRNAPRRRR